MKLTYKYITRGIKNTLWPILHWYDIAFKKELTVAVADLMLLRDGEMYNRQFYATSRLLDAKLYYEKGDDSFPYQVAVSYNYRPTSYNREKRSQEFKDLLESVKKNGYDKNSHLAIDKDLYLINGTHRIALAYYLNITEITVDCWCRRNIVNRSIEQWTASSLDSEILQNVFNEFNEIQHKLLENGESFILWLSGKEITSHKKLLCALTPYLTFYKFHKVKNTSKEYNGLHITDGILIQFIPLRADYVIKCKKYYSEYVFKIQDILAKRIKKSELKLDFYISPNCLQGKQFFSLLKNDLEPITFDLH